MTFKLNFSQLEYLAPKPWQGRIDSSTDPLCQRWHQKVACLNLEQVTAFNQVRSNVCFLGYASDLGVQRNQGRSGAKRGPELLRRYMANFPVTKEIQKDIFFDLGNFSELHQNLDELVDGTTNVLALLLNSGAFPILLGGGHDLALASVRAVAKNFWPQKVGVVNLDAHFDLREDGAGTHSGSAFYRYFQDCVQQNQPFHYLCVSVQETSNTTDLFYRAQEYKAQYILRAEFFEPQKVQQKILNFIQQVDVVLFSVCLDAFDISVAPGVSAPTVFGLNYADYLLVVQTLFASQKVVAMDVAELSPAHDEADKTARLGARVVFDAISLRSRS